MLAEINRIRKNWVNSLQEYESISRFLANLKLVEAEWGFRLDKLKEIETTLGPLAARRYIMTDLIPFSEKSLQELDQLVLTEAGQRLRASNKDAMLKKNSELREIAAMWSAPKKK